MNAWNINKHSNGKRCNETDSNLWATSLQIKTYAATIKENLKINF